MIEYVDDLFNFYLKIIKKNIIDIINVINFFFYIIKKKINKKINK